MAEHAAQDLKFINPISNDSEEGDDAFEDQIRRAVADEPQTPRNANMEEEMAQKSFVEKFAAFIGPGNVSAGAASALHVNIYLFALGMMLASPYYVRSPRLISSSERQPRSLSRTLTRRVRASYRTS